MSGNGLRAAGGVQKKSGKKAVGSTGGEALLHWPLCCQSAQPAAAPCWRLPCCLVWISMHPTAVCHVRTAWGLQ